MHMIYYRKKQLKKNENIVYTQSKIHSKNTLDKIHYQMKGNVVIFTEQLKIGLGPTYRKT